MLDVIKSTRKDGVEEAADNKLVEYLKHVVAEVAIPRHYVKEKENNRHVGEWIKAEFERIGLTAEYQGEWQNIVATCGEPASPYRIIIGAHYDSVPGSPGADDNASAVAGMLAVAKALKKYGDFPVLFVAFNREEDNLMGSTDFVRALLPEQVDGIECAHVLEMIGYCSHAPASQHTPQGLPINIGDVGDFIAVVANKDSNRLVDSIIDIADSELPSLPVYALKVKFGLEKMFADLLRSDHAPFWRGGIPALMWTDTSNFRNPHYHGSRDTPDTLDYVFMSQVVQLLESTVLRQLGETGKAL